MSDNKGRFVKSIYFVGIGGSGMYALASLAICKGYTVFGSDKVRCKKTDDLISKGAKIYFEHSESNINNNKIDVLVYSGAIGGDNPEIVAAKHNTVPCISRSKFLGMVASNFKNSVAVAGSHGKSTTTAIITSVLIDAGKDPTSVIGAYLSKIGGNSVLGKSDIMVCEACEFLDGFLDLDPRIGIILNIDNDHLDYFKNLNNEKQSFFKFAKKCQSLIVNRDDLNSFEISNKLDGANVICYGLSENSDFYAKDIEIDSNGCAKFNVFHSSNKIFDLHLKIPGVHNVLNALASVAACYLLKVDNLKIKKSIEEFIGIDRRFKFLGNINGVEIFDDFAHHPTEIRSVLNTARSKKCNDIWAVFQPHTFSRTYFLLDEFAESLSIADHVVLTDILPVRETNIYNISSGDLAKKIKGSVIINDFGQIADYLKQNVKPGDVILNIGAGTISECANVICQKFLQ